jgi:hypothetical protein
MTATSNGRRRAQGTPADTVQIQLDVTLGFDDFIVLLERIDQHPGLWRLWDERLINRLILLGLDDDGKPEHAGAIKDADLQRRIVWHATTRGYLIERNDTLAVDVDRFSIAEIGEIAQALAFGTVAYHTTS